MIINKVKLGLTTCGGTQIRVQPLIVTFYLQCSNVTKTSDLEYTCFYVYIIETRKKKVNHFSKLLEFFTTSYFFIVLQI